MTTGTRQHWKCDDCGCEAHCACREVDDFDAALTRLQRAIYSRALHDLPPMWRGTETAERELKDARAEVRRLYDASR